MLRPDELIQYQLLAQPSSFWKRCRGSISLHLTFLIMSFFAVLPSPPAGLILVALSKACLVFLVWLADMIELDAGRREEASEILLLLLPGDMLIEVELKGIEEDNDIACITCACEQGQIRKSQASKRSRLSIRA